MNCYRRASAHWSVTLADGLPFYADMQLYIRVTAYCYQNEGVSEGTAHGRVGYYVRLSPNAYLEGVGPHWKAGDLNGDCSVSFKDINPFVALLSGR